MTRASLAPESSRVRMIGAILVSIDREITSFGEDGGGGGPKTGRGRYGVCARRSVFRGPTVGVGPWAWIRSGGEAQEGWAGVSAV